MEVDLSEVKKGDWIWTIQSGWAKVCWNTEQGGQCINIDNYLYDTHGRKNPGDKYPSAFPSNPFDKDDLPPVEFKDGEIVMVKLKQGHTSIPIIYGGSCNGKVLTLDGTIWKYARKLSGKEKGL